jgi:hypothetical protein
MVKRGPQSVQLRKGQRSRRSPASASSPEHTSQVAMTGEIGVPSPGGRFAQMNLKMQRSAGTSLVHGKSFNQGQRWRVCLELTREAFQLGLQPFSLNGNAARMIENEAGRRMARGQRINERTETDSLHNAGNLQPPAFVNRHLARNYTRAGGLPRGLPSGLYSSKG